MQENILLIDDNPDDIEFYKHLIEQSENEYKVHTAQSASSAFDIFSKNDIYCVLIDFQMPELNGLQILEELQKISENKIIPMVILTGEPHQKVQAQAARMGALDYVVKDITNSAEQIDSVINKTVKWANELNKKI